MCKSKKKKKKIVAGREVMAQQGGQATIKSLGLVLQLVAMDHPSLRDHAASDEDCVGEHCMLVIYNHHGDE